SCRSVSQGICCHFNSPGCSFLTAAYIRAASLESWLVSGCWASAAVQSPATAVNVIAMQVVLGSFQKNIIESPQSQLLPYFRNGQRFLQLGVWHDRAERVR